MSETVNFDRGAALLKLPEGLYRHDGDKYQGLFLNVGKRKKTWYWRGRLGGKTRNISLGPFPSLSPQQAAQQAQKDVQHGANPTTAKVRSVRDAWAAYRIDARKNDRASDKHLDDLERKLDLNASRIMGMSPTQVSLLDVRDCLNAIESVATRHHVKAAISSAYSMLDVPAPFGRGKIKLKAVPKRETLWAAACRDHGFDEEDWSPMWGAIQGMGNALRRTAWEVMLFTGIRSNDVRSLTWDQVDLTAKTLTLIKMKNGLDRTLPVSDTVVTALTAIRSNHDFVFPASSKTGYIDHLDALKHNGVPVLRPHDTRKHFMQATAEALMPSYVAHWLRGDKQGAAGDEMLMTYLKRMNNRDAVSKIETVILGRIE